MLNIIANSDFYSMSKGINAFAYFGENTGYRYQVFEDTATIEMIVDDMDEHGDEHNKAVYSFSSLSAAIAQIEEMERDC